MKMYLLGGMLIFFGAIALKVIYNESATNRENAGTVAAQSLLALSGIVQAHVDAGETLPEGVAAPDSIPLPSWYRANLEGVTIVSEGGRAFVVAVYPSLGEAQRVRRAAVKSAEAFVGIAANSKVHLPGGEGTAVALPPGIPDGALVVPVPL